MQTIINYFNLRYISIIKAADSECKIIFTLPVDKCTGRCNILFFRQYLHYTEQVIFQVSHHKYSVKLI